MSWCCIISASYSLNTTICAENMQIAWLTEAMLKVWSWVKSISITQELVWNVISWFPPQAYWSRNWWWSSAISVLTSPPGGSLKNSNNKLQVYSIIIQYLYKLQSDHHHKSSCHLWPYSWLSSTILPISHPHSPVLTTNLISAFDFYFVHLLVFRVHIQVKSYSDLIKG